MVLANYMIGGHSTSRLHAHPDEGWAELRRQFQPGAAGRRNCRGLHPLRHHRTANAGKVEAAMKEELIRALKDGFPADEVAGAKKGWRRSRRK